MKKAIPILAALSLLLAAPCSVSASAAEKTAVRKPADVLPQNSASAFYEATLNSSKFRNETIRAARGELLQLSNDVLKSISTADLVEAVLDYPFFVDVYAFENIQDGFDKMQASFSGLQELMNRSDAARVILEKYQKESVPEYADETNDLFRINNLEILLSQTWVLKQLSAGQRSTLMTEAENKRRLKSASELYNDYSADLFSELIEKNPEKAALLPKTSPQISLRSIPVRPGGRDGAVTTPNGSWCKGRFYHSGEDWTAEQKNQLDQTYQNAYPDAVLLKTANRNYNCHSYAFYMADKSFTPKTIIFPLKREMVPGRLGIGSFENLTNESLLKRIYNEFWMFWPDIYWEDGSYYEVDVQNASNGTRFEYFDANLPDGEKCIHSAVVCMFRRVLPTEKHSYTRTGTPYPDNIIVESKWGPMGLFRHRVGDCPYSGDADYFKCYNRDKGITIVKPELPQNGMKNAEFFEPIEYWKEPDSIPFVPSNPAGPCF